MEQEPKPAPAAPAAPVSAKKRGKSTMLLLSIALILVGTSASALTVYGPNLVSKARAAIAHRGAPAEGDSQEKESEAHGEAVVIDPIIVDVRGSDAELHHLKVGLAIELAKAPSEEEHKRIIPRVRDATIVYLRTLTLEDVTSPNKFEEIRRQLADGVSRAVVKPHVRRVLFTDFVAQ